MDWCTYEVESPPNRFLMNLWNGVRENWFPSSYFMLWEGWPIQCQQPEWESIPLIIKGNNRNRQEVLPTFFSSAEGVAATAAVAPPPAPIEATATGPHPPPNNIPLSKSPKTKIFLTLTRDRDKDGREDQIQRWWWDHRRSSSPRAWQRVRASAPALSLLLSSPMSLSSPPVNQYYHHQIIIITTHLTRTTKKDEFQDFFCFFIIMVMVVEIPSSWRIRECTRARLLYRDRHRRDAVVVDDGFGRRNKEQQLGFFCLTLVGPIGERSVWPAFDSSSPFTCV